MKKFKFAVVLSQLALGIVGAVGIIACSSEPKVADLPDSTDPQEVLERVDGRIADARDRQISVLAPENFSHAVEYRNDAVEARASGKAQKKILHDLAVSEAYLDKANATADITRPMLQDVAQSREDAIKASSWHYYPQAMRDTDKRFTEMTSAIESGGSSQSLLQNKNKVAAEYQNLELLSIKDANLTQARRNTNEAIHEGAEKLTPETLSWMREKLAMSQKTIENNPHDTKMISMAADDATASSEKLLKMVRQAKLSKDAKPETIAQKLVNSEAVAQDATTDLEKSKVQLSEQLEKQSGLESQVWLEQEFAKANDEFTKDEAEVYKQGDRLLLRLKGLNFPKNEAVLTPDNFPLLAKVQTVLANVSPSDVIVEGHTDSTGNKKVNETLSQRRAEAVESYLVSNNNVPNTHISAKGYGYSKPIASNKTAEGRAQNRRVDIVIISRQGAKPQDQTQSD